MSKINVNNGLLQLKILSKIEPQITVKSLYKLYDQLRLK